MQDNRIVKTRPKRILVITLRFLGDTLLATPLLASLKRAYSDATIDVLTFKANVAMLENNPDINQLITLDGRPKTSTFAKLLITLFRKYDLAISTQAGDRPILCAIMAGKISLGFVTDEQGKSWWKKWLLTYNLVFSQDYDHAVLENLRFCEPLGIQPHYKLRPPQTSLSLPLLLRKPYAVLHIMPQWRYKQWHKEGWLKLIRFLDQRNLHIIFTGSNQVTELSYLNDLQKKLNISVSNLAGQLSLAQLTELITDAELFVGPDTGITHLAAATGTKTFAIYGPTDPKKWAPWPFEYVSKTSPFLSSGSQQLGNVHLIQGNSERNCVPCQLEGCERHRSSHSACLDNLSSEKVIDIIASALDSL